MAGTGISAGECLWDGLSICVRAVYIGLVVGLVVGTFRLAEASVTLWLVPLLGQSKAHSWSIPLCFACMVPLAWAIGFLVRGMPDISGSGIPQVELTLHDGRRCMWSKLLWAKFLGSWLAIAGGLSLGREGPCIQMGAAVGVGVNAVWGQKALRQNPAIIAGAAAGLGAAFGAPLAGCVFVYEEMRCSLRPWVFLGVLVAVFTAQASIGLGFGLHRILPFTGLRAPSPSQYGLVAVFGLVIGLAGVFYTHCLLALKDADARQQVVPQNLRTLPALWCAAGLMFVEPRLLGGGDSLIFALNSLSTQAGATLQSTLFVLLFLGGIKFVFALCSYTGGVPGGLLMPMLCIGALFGAAAGQWLGHMQWIDPEQATGFILLGMSGYFAAIVRAPLTGIVLTLEMTGAWEFLPSCLVVGYAAYVLANATGTAPVYDSLKARVRLAHTRGTAPAA
ncbi:MAG: ClC family H(+)/Cl(-) exchange transporter [Desulfovibrionaceae bacterium]